MMSDKSDLTTTTTVSQNGTDQIVVIEKKTKVKPSEPSLYRVLLLNDDYTPMDFVTMVLEKVFDHSHERATALMLEIHQKNSATAGIYPFEIAETKVSIVTEKARSNDYPLQCKLEKDS